MSRRKKKINSENKKSIIFSPKVLTFFCLVLLILLSVPVVKKIKQKQRVDAEITNLQEEVASLEKENQELDKLIEYLKSDQFLEEQTRMNLGFKKPGEEVLVITEEEKKQKTAEDFSSDKSREEGGGEKYSRSNPQKWWNHFFN